MAVTKEDILKLRQETGAGVMDCRKALEKADGEFDMAIEYIREMGESTAAERSEKETLEGVVELYSHGNGRVGVMVEVNCETDFVARSEAFRTFAHEIALQIAASEPAYVTREDVPEDVIEAEKERARSFALEEGKPENVIDRIVEGKLNKFLDEACLVRQPYIRNDEITIEKLLLQNIASIGENIVIRRFERWELGENMKD
jgi:elongation factor Ts